MTRGEWLSLAVSLVVILYGGTYLVARRRGRQVDERVQVATVVALMVLAFLAAMSQISV